MKELAHRLFIFAISVLALWGFLTSKPVAAQQQEQAAPDRKAPAVGTVERWYVLEMMKARCGWMHSKETTTHEAITTESEMKFSVKRGAIQINASIESQFVEAHDGTPIRMRSVQKFGTMPVDQTYVFKGDKLELTSKQGDQVTTTLIDGPKGSWLTPAAANRFVTARRAAGAKEISVRIIEPSSGVQPVLSKHVWIGPDTINVLGKDIECTKWEVAVSGEKIPDVKSFEYVDSEDVILRTDTSYGGIGIVMLLSTRQEATEDAAAPEMMVSTFVTPDRSIPNAREVRRASYLLSIPEGEMPELPGTGSQKSVPVDQRSARVMVDASMPHAAAEADSGNPKYLAATAMTDINDDLIVRLKGRATKDAGNDKAERAEAMRRFVHQHIRKKSLDVGFATASETARSRAGDCSEHGVLLAALLRADGIPARVASGLVYADSFAGGRDIFGYHMWSQALLDVGGVTRWVDLDATFPDEVPYDATHIALGTSDLADGEIAGGMMQLAPLLGRLKIKVESAK